jgi:uncharacterized small protein (DUF1192 family)
LGLSSLSGDDPKKLEFLWRLKGYDPQKGPPHLSRPDRPRIDTIFPGLTDIFHSVTIHTANQVHSEVNQDDDAHEGENLEDSSSTGYSEDTDTADTPIHTSQSAKDDNSASGTQEIVGQGPYALQVLPPTQEDERNLSYSSIREQPIQSSVVDAAALLSAAKHAEQAVQLGPPIIQSSLSTEPKAYHEEVQTPIFTSSTSDDTKTWPPLVSEESPAPASNLVEQGVQHNLAIFTSSGDEDGTNDSTKDEANTRSMMDQGTQCNPTSSSPLLLSPEHEDNGPFPLPTGKDKSAVIPSTATSREQSNVSGSPFQRRSATPTFAVDQGESLVSGARTLSVPSESLVEVEDQNIQHPSTESPLIQSGIQDDPVSSTVPAPNNRGFHSHIPTFKSTLTTFRFVPEDLGAEVVHDDSSSERSSEFTDEAIPVEAHISLDISATADLVNVSLSERSSPSEEDLTFESSSLYGKEDDIQSPLTPLSLPDFPKLPSLSDSLSASLIFSPGPTPEHEGFIPGRRTRPWTSHLRHRTTDGGRPRSFDTHSLVENPRTLFPRHDGGFSPRQRTSSEASRQAVAGESRRVSFAPPPHKTANIQTEGDAATIAELERRVEELMQEVKRLKTELAMQEHRKKSCFARLIEPWSSLDVSDPMTPLALGRSWLPNTVGV